MSISIEKRQAYSEVLEFVYLLDKKYIDKIPKKLLNYFEKEKDKSYKKNINPWEPIEKQNLKKDTITLISLLNLKYWITEQERKKLINSYKGNDLKYQEECKKRYNPNNIFKNDDINIEISNKNTDISLSEVKISFWAKVKNFIHSIFK